MADEQRDDRDKQQDGSPQPLPPNIGKSSKTEGETKDERESSNPNTQQQTHDEHKTIIIVKDKRDWVMLTTQIALVFVGVASVIIFYWLGSNQNRLTLQTVQTSVRPYVHFRIEKYVRLEVGHPVSTPYEIVNNGESPAFHVEVMGDIILEEGMPTDQAERFKEMESKHSNPGFVVIRGFPSGQDMIGDNFTREDSASVFRQAGTRKWIHLYVAAKYSDQFGKVYYTWTCMTYMPEPREGSTTDYFYLTNQQHSGMD